MIRLILAASMMLLPFFANAETGVKKESVKEFRPSNAFLANVSPITSRLSNVHYFQAGEHLVGVTGENELVNNPAQRPVIMFFDASGEYLMAGQVIEWKTKRNMSGIAAQQFMPETALAQSAKNAIKEQDKLAEKYQAALKQDIERSNREFAERNNVSAKDAVIEIENGLPLIVIGKGNDKIVAFIDFECDSCVNAAYDLIRFSKTEAGKNWSIGFAIYANPSDSQSMKTASIVYGSKEKLISFQLALEKKLGADDVAEKRGAMALGRIQTSVRKLKIKTLPYFVVTKNGGLKDQSGYSNVDALVK